MNALIMTPFQQSADGRVAASWQAWDNGDYASSLADSLYARIGYIADLIASIVLFPLSLIGLAFGSLHALYLWDTQKSTLLHFSNQLFTAKRERFFTSLLGSFISPAIGYYFKSREVTPMVIGVVVTALASYMVLKNPPPPIDWHLALGH